MATFALPQSTYHNESDDVRFAARIVIAMALTIIAGFSLQWLMGRSTFAAPLRVHAHAIAFMGWMVLFVTQSQLALRGNFALHRTIGKIAALWLVYMLVAALTVIVAMVRNGTIPFFFAPQQLLIGDPMTMFAFLGLTIAALAKRRQSDWHIRLHICALSAIMGPAFGRLLPMPLLKPYAFETAVLAGMLFIFIGAWRDRRTLGAVHPAWRWGIGTIAFTVLALDAIAYSPVGDGIYAAVTKGYPGESVPGLAFPPVPGTPLRTGT